MSQPPFQPVGAPQGGGVVPPPAAPTQIAFPGQVQLAPQPQYNPAPQHVAPQQFATGFPQYVPPRPAPGRKTGYIVGAAVIIALVIFAVVGFLLVS